MSKAKIDFVKEDAKKHFTEASSYYHLKNYELAGKHHIYPDIYIRHKHILGMIDGLHGDALEIGCGSGEMLPFPDNSFDLIIAAGVVMYLNSVDKAFKELYRVLRPNGHVVISFRNMVNLSKPLTTIRDLLRNVPIISPALTGLSTFTHNLLSLAENTSFPHRLDIPWQTSRKMRAMGLIPKEQIFFRFSIFPRFLEKRFPSFCIRGGLKMEVFSRSFLGYLANQFIIRAQKTDRNL